MPICCNAPASRPRAELEPLLGLGLAYLAQIRPSSADLAPVNPEQAAQAAEDLQARALTPGHVGRFSISPHDWDDPFKRITMASRGRSYALWTPEIGRPIYLDGRAQAFTAWWETVKSD